VLHEFIYREDDVESQGRKTEKGRRQLVGIQVRELSRQGVMIVLIYSRRISRVEGRMLTVVQWL